MIDANEGPTPKPRFGRLIWMFGLTLGVIAGAIVAFELTMLGG